MQTAAISRGSAVWGVRLRPATSPTACYTQRLLYSSPCRRFSCSNRVSTRSHDAFPSRAPESASRNAVERVLNDVKAVYTHPRYEVEALGAYRRGAENVDAASLLIVDVSDERRPSFGDNYDQDTNLIAKQLTSKGVLRSDESGRHRGSSTASLEVLLQ